MMLKAIFKKLAKNTLMIIFGFSMLVSPSLWAAAGGQHCAARLQEIQDYIKDNPILSFFHDKLHEAYQQCLKDSSCTPELPDLCHWADPAWAVLQRHDFKNVGLIEKDKRCVMLRELAAVYEKEWNALAGKFATAPLITKEQQEKYLTTVGERTFFNLDTIQLQQNYIQRNRQPLIHYTIASQGLAGECGDSKLDYIFFTPMESQSKQLHKLIASVVPKEVSEVKKFPLQTRDFMQKQFARSNYTYYYSEHIDHLDERVFSFTYGIYTYTGGAHGGTVIFHSVFDLKTSKAVQLEDIFSTEYIDDLMQLARKKFLAQNELQTSKGWDEQGFWFKKEDALKVEKTWLTKDGFYLPRNFTLGNQGITFLYQQYEVASYASGMPTFTLPWQDIAPYVVKNGIASHFLVNTRQH